MRIRASLGTKEGGLGKSKKEQNLEQGKIRSPPGEGGTLLVLGVQKAGPGPTKREEERKLVDRSKEVRGANQSNQVKGAKRGNDESRPVFRTNRAR